MPRLSLAALLVCAVSLLSGCLETGNPAPGGPEDGVTANAVVGNAIEVTPLDAPAPGGDDPAQATDADAAEDTAAPPVAPEQDIAEADPAKATPEPTPEAEVAATPVTPKSEMQLACEKRGGSWFKIGEGDKRACVRMTRDQGKRCERESQCESVCLARSGTCAPFKPMYGCNEILQDNGARVTLCLE